MDNLKNFHRTNYCGDLRLSDAGKTVSLCGCSGSGTWAG